LCGKIKFKRLQTKPRTIAEKLGTGKSTDTVHSTVLRKNYRLVEEINVQLKILGFLKIWSNCEFAQCRLDVTF